MGFDMMFIMKCLVLLLAAVSLLQLVFLLLALYFGRRVSFSEAIAYGGIKYLFVRQVKKNFRPPYSNFVIWCIWFARVDLSMLLILVVWRVAEQ